MPVSRLSILLYSTRGIVAMNITPAIISSSGPSRTRNRCETTRGTTFATSTSDTSHFARGSKCNQSVSESSSAADAGRRGDRVVNGPAPAQCRCMPMSAASPRWRDNELPAADVIESAAACSTRAEPTSPAQRTRCARTNASASCTQRMPSSVPSSSWWCRAAAIRSAM